MLAAHRDGAARFAYRKEHNMLATLTRLFPLWALLLSVLAYYTPTTFTPIGPWVTTLQMLIKFGMGVHLK
ncbi:hypothetical protein QU621_16415, partial [Klebsiella pneumoniae]|nr:hypothetical protein [Klebsiella pneumoniae]